MSKTVFVQLFIGLITNYYDSIFLTFILQSSSGKTYPELCGLNTGQHGIIRHAYKFSQIPG